MNGYLISTADRAGVAASLFEAAAARRVNVFPAYGLADGTTGLILVGSNDEAGLQASIADAGLTARALEMVVTQIQDRPGTGAEIMRKISDAGVNLLAAVPVGMDEGSVQIAFAGDDTAALKRALGQ
jgi:hypothetical protein